MADGGPCQRRHAEGWRVSAPRSRAGIASAEPAEGGLYVQSVEKAFAVLHAFAGRSRMGLTEVAAATGLDRSAAQRFLHTLERLGYLRKDPRSRQFELTVRMLELGRHYIAGSALVERAQPFLLHLSRQTEEAVNLTVLDGAEIVYVARLLSRHAIAMNLSTGSRLPAYCTAPGIAILSRLPKAEATAILRRSNRRAYTPQTVTGLAALGTRIERAARRGYAICVEEIYPSDISVAAAILGPGGEPVAAVNISVSRLRSTPKEAEARLAPLVMGAAAAMSQAPPLELSA